MLNTSLGSNFNYRESFPGKPYNLSIGLNHSQNTQSRDVTINFPTVNFQTQTLFPFKSKKPSSKEHWYEKIALTYNGEAKATVSAKDTTLFTQETLDAVQYGAKHNVNTNASFKLFRFFNVNPRVTYDEIWFFKTNTKFFDPTLEIDFEEQTNAEGETQLVPVDTVFGTVIDSLTFGFKPLRKFNAGVNMDTKLFGTVLFKKGFLRGIRHVITPGVGLSFSPDYTNPNFGYFKEVRTSTLDDDLLEYSIFGTGLYAGERPSNVGRRMALDFGINSNVEAKLFSKRDSTTRNVRILRTLDIDGGYNFAAEEFKWEQVSVRTNLSLFNGIVSVVLNANFDPYSIDEEGTRVPVLLWEDQRKLARFQDARASVSTSLTVRKIKEMFTGKTETGASNVARVEEGLLSILENFSIRHNLVYQGRGEIQGDTFFVSTNTITLNGSVKLTDQWLVSLGSFGYDFSQKKITFPSLSVTRDLHCWNMGMSWQPTRGTYAFFIRVDPGSVFDFINVPYQRGNQDTNFGDSTFRGF